ncbi:MAG: hypothetical protein CMB99_16205 [Flavobacteriaceae bacterium]|nr:hypothetical protein [Flavobacteriaceae bacterium]|tara:strand:- start:17468 stop:17647 length:180 start_codon:yes stop_codon:yes gene_type:complete
MQTNAKHTDQGEQIQQLESRLSFLMLAAGNDEINPVYERLLSECHCLALELSIAKEGIA